MGNIKTSFFRLRKLCHLYKFISVLLIFMAVLLYKIVHICVPLPPLQSMSINAFAFFIKFLYNLNGLFVALLKMLHQRINDFLIEL